MAWRISMNASSTVNRIAADSTVRSGASSPRRRRKMLADPERQRGNAVAPQQPVEDRRGADRLAGDARLVADPQHHDAGENGGERTQERDRPLHRDPGRAHRHQRQRDGEPAFFQRKGQRQRQRAKRAGGEQRGRNRQSRPRVTAGERFGRRAIGGGEDHRQDRERESSGRDARCGRKARSTAPAA